jgi:hypothetical protein
MAKNLHKKRNERLKMARAKSKKLEKGLGIEKEDWKRAVATKHVIDTGKRTPNNPEPRMTE